MHYVIFVGNNTSWRSKIVVENPIASYRTSYIFKNLYVHMRSKQHIFKFGKNGKTVQARKSTDLQAQTRVKEM